MLPPHDDRSLCRRCNRYNLNDSHHPECEFHNDGTLSLDMLTAQRDEARANLETQLALTRRAAQERDEAQALADKRLAAQLRGALQEYMRVLRWNPEHCQCPGTCMHCVATKRAKAALEMKP